MLWTRTPTPIHKRRRLLFEQLEDRLLFDAVPIPMPAGVEPSMVDSFDTTSAFESIDLQNAGTQGQGQTRRELVVVDTSVEDYERLVADLLSGADSDRQIEVVTIDGKDHDGNGGMGRLSEILDSYSNLDALHLITHGSESTLQLGSETIDFSDPGVNAAEIAQWSRAFSADADILIYGCDFGAGDGAQSAQLLAQLTGTDVAASDDLTGSADQGGDWDLEVIIGQVESAFVVNSATWEGVLAATSTPVPTATLDVPDSAMINEDFDFTVSFNNTGAAASDVGYGPFIDLSVPPGLDLNSASYLGSPVTMALAGTFDASGDLVDALNQPVLHPLTNLAVTGTPGEDLYVVQLPFGSFVPDQPIADIVISATTNSTDGAIVGTQLDIDATAGFAFGCDPLDNPATDPPIYGATVTDDVTPDVIDLIKRFDAPDETETATGENYPITYELVINVADGETVTAVDLVDLLPNAFVYVGGSISVDSSGSGGITGLSQTQLPTTGSPQNSPNNDFLIEFDSIVGTTDLEDVVVSYTIWVSDLDANNNPVIDPLSGDATTVTNDSSVTGTYGGATVGDDDVFTDETLEQRSIATQKGVVVINDIGGPGATPGDTLEYTIEVQISDYFEFSNVVISDTFNDGQRFDTSYTPQFIISEGGVTSALTDFNNANYTVTLNSDGAPPTPLDGSTDVVFDIFAEVPDGVLTGDLFADSTLNGATTVTVKFRTVIQDDFTDTFTSGDESVDIGDLLSNTTSVTGILPSTQTETDTGATSISITGPSVEKAVYAIDGILFVPGSDVVAGHTTTYRLTMSLPTSDVENLVLTDYLPLPFFDATEVSTTFDASIAGTIPPAGIATYGPSHTLDTVVVGTSPTVSTDGVANTLKFDFGSFDVDPSAPSTIDILFTVTGQDVLMADGLTLQNQVLAEYGNTGGSTTSSSALAPVVVAAPVLKLTKGIVATDAVDPTFDDVTVGPVTFNAPGSATSFTGGINSTNLNTDPIDSNLIDADAGDLVTFAVVVENTGGADGFNLTIADTLPLGGEYITPTVGGLNLQVRDGDGNLLSLATGATAADLFTVGGLEIEDPSFSVGAINNAEDALAAGNGSNIIVITYDLELAVSVEPEQIYTNNAEVAGFGAVDGGSNHTTGNSNDDWADDATVETLGFQTTKSIISTSESHTGVISGVERVAIGEIVRYQLAVEIPEGTMTDIEIRDRLPSGLQYLNDGTATVAFIANGVGITSNDIAGTLDLGLGTAPGIVGTVATTPVFALPDANVGSTSSTSFVTNTFDDNDTYNQGTDPYFKFGQIVNADSDADKEYIVVEFNALVLNQDTASNDHSDSRDNYFELRVGNVVESSTTDDRVRVTVTEPLINNVAKTVEGVETYTGDAGDVVTYSITFSNSTSSTRTTAFDVRLLDTVTDDLTVNLATLNVNMAGGTTGLTDASSGNTIDVTFDEIPIGGSVTITFDATLDVDVQSNEVLVNDATVTYTSLPGAGTSSTDTVNNPTGSTTPLSSGQNRGERNGGSGTQNDYTDTDSASVQITSPTLAKTLVGTSIVDADNDNDEAVIGETIQYSVTVTLPEGTTDAAQILDTLDAGLSFVSLDSITTSANVTSNTVDLSDATSIAAPAVGATGSLTFALGDVVNNNPTDGAGTAHTIVVVYTVRVDNLVGNQGDANPGDLLANSASFGWEENGTATTTDTSSAAQVEVIEANIDVVKIADVAIVDAGDEINYTITIDHNALSDTAAYDLTFSDLIPTDVNVDFADVTVTHSTTGDIKSLFELTAGNELRTATPNTFDLLLGESVVITIQGQVAPTVFPTQILSNAATTNWTSIDGTDANERNGDDGSGGALDDYAETSSAAVAVVATIEVTKDLINTSVVTSNNSNTEAVIGELIQYQVTVELPEAVISGSELIDTLDLGLEFVSLDSIEAFSGGVATADITSTVGSFATTALFDPAAPVGDGITVAQVLNFDLGTISNSNTSNANVETIVLTYTVRVLNTSANTGNDAATGQLLNNSAQFGWDAGGTPETSNVDSAETVEVLEPNIDIEKVVDVISVDAGDEVNYTITIDHNAASDTDAYDLTFTDLVPTSLVVDFADVTVTHSTLGDIKSLFELTGGNELRTIAGNSFDVLLGENVEITIKGEVVSTVFPGQGISNTGTVDWSSLDGADANERDGADGEAGALDDYEESSTAAVAVVGAPTVTKDLVSTSIVTVNNTNTEAVIGELIQYRVELEIPEAVITDAELIDTLDLGLEFVSLDSIEAFSAGVATADITSTIGSFATTALFDPAAPVGDGITVAQVLNFDLGTLSNGNTVNANVETLVLTYTVRVLNAPTNTSNGSVTGQLLNNSAQFGWDAGGTPTTSNVDSADTVEVIEPELEIEKLIDDDTPHLGQIVTYTVTIDHTTNSDADAHDITFSDSLPSGLTLDLLTLNVVGATVVTDTSAANAINLVLDDLVLGSTITITYDAIVTTDESKIGDGLNNTGLTTWTSLSDGITTGATTERDGDAGNGGEDDYSDSSSESATITHPLVELEKDFISSAPAASGIDGNFDLTYDFTISSTGNDPLTNLSLLEDVATQYGSAFVGIVLQSGATATLQPGTTANDVPELNSAYDGGFAAAPANTELFDNSGANTNNLAPGELIVVRIIFEVDPNAVGAILTNGDLVNQATVSGTGEDTMFGVTDLSDDPDNSTNADGDPGTTADDDGNPDDPNTVRFPQISLQKETVGEPVPASLGTAGNFDVTYRFTITNTGTTTLDNLVLNEDLLSQFGTAFKGIVLQSGAPAIIVNPGVISDDPGINNAFDGTSANANIFDGSTSLLDVNETLIIEIIVEIDPDDPGAILDAITSDGTEDFENRAIVTADDPGDLGTSVSDMSDDPTYDDDTMDPADPDNDDEDPTTVSFGAISLTKTAGVPVEAADGQVGHFDVTYTFVATNVGVDDLDNIILTDDWAGQFGDGFVGIVETQASASFSDLVISEVWDNNGGSLGYIEIYNGTGATIDLTDYRIDRYGSYLSVASSHAYTFPTTATGSTIADGETLIGRANNGGSGVADFDFQGSSAGFNANDRLELIYTPTETLIDNFEEQLVGSVGYIYRRNSSITGPNSAFTASEWTLATSGDESDLGSFNAANSTQAAVSVTAPVASGIDGNTSYTGDVSDNILDGAGILKTGESVTVTVTVRIDPSATLATLVDGTLQNSATVVADDENGDPVDDTSDDPTDADDTDNDADNDPDSPTNLSFAAIDLQKTISTTTPPAPAASGTQGNYDVTYEFLVENTGTEILSNLTLTDDFETQFADAFVAVKSVSVTNISATSPPTANDSTEVSPYDGTTGSDLLVGAATDDLKPGQQFKVILVVELDPDHATASYNPAGELENTATVTGDGENGGSATDISDDDNDTTAGDDPTTLLIADVELEKTATATADAASGLAGHYDITYEFEITNTGNDALTNLQLTDDWNTEFGDMFVAIVDVDLSNNVTVPVASGIGGNSSYNGGSAENMLDGLGTLLVGETITVTIVVEVDPSADPTFLVNGTLENTATVTGDDSASNSIGDISDDPTDSDNTESEGDNDPDSPTNVSFADIQLTKTVFGTPTPAASTTAGNFDVVYHLIVTNTGTEALSNLSLLDDLDSQFGDAFQAVVSLSIINDGATSSPTLNDTGVTAYDGTTGSDMFVGAVTDDLKPGESFTVVLTVELDPDNAGATYNVSGQLENSATTSGDGENGGSASDTSDDDTDSVSGDDPTTLLIPDVQLEKTATLIAPASSSTPGNYNITYEFVITNTGNDVLDNLQLVDNWAGQFGTMFVGIVDVDLTNGDVVAPGGSAIGGDNNYLGGSTENMLDALGTLASGESVTVTVIVEVDPDSDPSFLVNGTLQNSATITADGSAGGSITDTSDDPTDTDDSETEGDNEPDSPTNVTIPDIDLTKTVFGSPIPASDGSIGNFDVTYDFVITNIGSEVLSNLSLLDDFDTQFEGAFQRVVSMSIVNDGSTNAPTLNNAGVGQYDGTMGSDMLLGAVTDDLRPAESFTVRIVVELDPDNATAVFNLAGELENQATTTGVGENGGMPTDDSDDSSDAIDDDDPTTLLLPQVQLEKQAINQAVASSGTVGNFDVTYRFTLTNTGNDVLTNVTITDDWNTQFGAMFQGIVDADLSDDVAGSATVAGNAAYAGLATENLLAAGSTLQVGEAVTVLVTVEVDPNADPALLVNSTLENTAETTADGTNTSVDDTSDDPTDTDDTDNDGDNDTDSPTNVALPDVSLVKRLSTTSPPTIASDGTWDVEFTLEMTNTGSTVLDGLTLFDNLTAAGNLGATWQSTTAVSIDTSGVTTGSLPAINSAWQTDPTENILTGAGSLNVNDVIIVTFTVNIDPDISGSSSADLSNQAIAGGDDPFGTTVNDDSDDPIDGGADDDDPTAIDIADIGVAKQVNLVTNLGTGIYEVEYVVVIENTGTVNLSNIDVTEDLEAQLGLAFDAVVTGPEEVVALRNLAAGSVMPTINSGWTGTTAGDTLLVNGDGTDVLQPGDSFVIKFVVELDATPPNGGDTTPPDDFTNTVTATADGANGDSAYDESDDGTNPNSDGGDGDEDTPSPFLVPQIRSAKSHGVATLNADGSYTVPVTILVENTGTAVLNNLTLVDDIITEFGPAFIGVSNQSVQAVGAWTGTLPSVNPAWTTADTAPNMIAGGVLEVNEAYSFTFNVTVDPDLIDSTSQFLNNQATVSGDGLDHDGSTVTVNDESGNETTIEDGIDNDNPTPLIIPEVILTKRLVSQDIASSGTAGNLDAVYEFILENTGTVTLESLSITDDWTTQFGDMFVGIVDIDLSDDTSSPIASGVGGNATYNGASASNMLDGLGQLLPGELVTVRLTVEVDPDAEPGKLDNGYLVNQATANGTYDPTPGTDGDETTVGDLSDDPDDTANNEGEGTTDGEPDDPTRLTVADLQVAKFILTSPVPASSDTPGNFDVSYTFVITNTGSESLSNLSLTDDLETQFGDAFVAVVDVQVIASSATTAPVANNTANNPGGEYDGTAGSDLLLGSAMDELRPTESYFVTLVVEIDPNAASATYNASGELENSATTTGLGENGNTAQDISHNSANSSGTNDPSDLDNEGDEPTTLIIADVELQKTALSSDNAVSGTAGNFDVTYQFVITNTGNQTLDNLQLVDDWAGQYGNMFVRIVDVDLSDGDVVAPLTSGIDGDADYQGGPTENILDGAGSLPTGETVTVTVIVEVNPDADPTFLQSGTLENSATITADDPFNTPVTDVSDDPTDGDDTESEGDNDPDSPTNVSLANIDLTKNIIGSPQPASDGSIGNFDVTYDFVITNTGSEILSNLSLTDDFAGQFGGAFQRIVSMTIINDGSTNAPTLNNTGLTAYDGTNGSDMLSGSATDDLRPSESFTVQVVVELDPDNATAVYNTDGQLENSADVYGDGENGGSAHDVSDDSTIDDDNNDPTDDDNDGDDPTVFRVSDIELEKTAISTQPAASGISGNWDITYQYLITNTGNFDLHSLTLTDDWDTQFGGMFVGIVDTDLSNGDTVVPTGSGIVGDNNYVGGATENMLDGLGILKPAETVTVTIIVEVNPDADPSFLVNGALQNSANTTGLDQSNNPVDDTSDDPTDGDDTNPDGDNDPDSPTDVRLPEILVQKQQFGLPVPATSGTLGNWDVTFDIVIENIGSTPLDQLSLTEDLFAQFGPVFVRIVPDGGQPAILLSGSTATNDVEFNTAFDGNASGSGDSQLFSNSGSDTNLLNVAESFTIRIVVEIDPDATGTSTPLVNSVETMGTDPGATDPGATDPVSDTSDDPTDADTSNPDLDNDPDGPTVVIVPDIAVVKSFVSWFPVADYLEVTYEVTVENIGTVQLDNITLTDDLTVPFGVALLSVTPLTQTDINVSSTATVDPTVNVNFNGDGDQSIFVGANGTLLPGEFVTIQFTALIDPALITAPNPLLNQANTSGEDADGNLPTDASDSGTDPNTNNPGEPGDTPNNSDDPTPVDLPLASIGDLIYFDLDNDGVFNGSDRGEPGVDITLQMDIDGDGIIDNTMTTTTDADGLYSFDFLLPGTYTITVDPSDLTGGILGLGSGPTDDPDGTATPHTTTFSLGTDETNTDQDFGYHATPDYVINKDDSLTNAEPGDTITYSILVENVGDLDGTGVIVSDSYPTNVLENVIASSGGIVDPVLGTISWNVGDLARGTSVLLTVTADVLNPVEAAIHDFTNTASVGDDGYHGADPTPENNTNTDQDILDAFPDYSITKDDGLLSAVPGQSITYTLTVSNVGNQNGTGVVVDDLFPTASLTNVSASAGGIVDPVAGTIHWDLGNLDAGDTVILSVTADVINPAAAGIHDITNTVTVTDDGTNGDDPNPDNNSDFDTDTLIATPDLVITKDDGDVEDVQFNESITYTITYSNVGNQDATGVFITEVPPIDVTFDASASEPGWVDNMDGTFDFFVGDLAAGDTFTVTYEVIFDKFPAPGTEEIFNTVFIEDDGNNGPDPTPENNMDTDGTTVVVFGFDSFTDSSGQRLALNEGVNVHPADNNQVGRRLPPLPIDTMFSGIVNPGTTLVGKIYDDEGRLIGEQTVVAGAAGNWLMQFPTTVIHETPYAMRLEQTAAIQNSSTDTGFSMRRYFHPAVHPQLFMTERLSISQIYTNQPSNLVHHMHTAFTDPLGFDLNLNTHAHELAVSSTNTSAM